MLIAIVSTLIAPGLIQAATVLPEGRLTLFAGNAHGVNFIIEDQRSRLGDTVTVGVFRVYGSPITMDEGDIVQEVDTLTIDCAARRIRVDAISGFTLDGRMIASLPGEDWAPIAARTTHDFTARVVCDGAQLPANATVVGHAAARQAARVAVAR